MADQDFNPYAAPSREADYEFGVPLATVDGILATPWQRWLGAFLDLLVVFLAALPVGIAGGLWSATGDELDEDTITALIMIPVALLSIVQWILVARNGQSIGKRIVKTRIVRLDGSPPGFVYGVLMRSWIPGGLQFIPLVGSFIGLADALFVFRDDRRTIHDHIAGTRVIQV